MKKLIGVLVVLFITLVMISIFGYFREFGVLDNMGTKIYASYGFIGLLLFYSIYGAVFIGITSWAVKTSWRKITNEKNRSTDDTQINHISFREEDRFYEQALSEIEEDNKKVKATWAKALALSNGNMNIAESLYIKERVTKIKNEQIEIKENIQKDQEYKDALAEEEEKVFGKSRKKEIESTSNLIPIIVFMIIIISTVITNIFFKN